MKKLLPIIAVFFLIAACKKSAIPLQSDNSISSLAADESEADINANAVRIGTQIWQTKNLDVSYYRNGDRIPQIKGGYNWGTTTKGAWCWYNNDSATYAATYGKLYNWYALNDPRGLAPLGWHIPSYAEWDTLVAFLGGKLVAGGKMKQTGTDHWFAPNTRATNKSGFTALPGGERGGHGSYNESFYANFWTSTEGGPLGFAYARSLSFSDGAVSDFINGKEEGYSIRCIKN